MSDIQQRIAGVLWRHLLLQTNPPQCGCGGWLSGRTTQAWNEHVAEVLVSELGLEPTYVRGWMGAAGMVRVTPPMHGEAWPDEPAKRYVRWGTTKWELADE